MEWWKNTQTLFWLCGFRGPVIILMPNSCKTVDLKVHSNLLIKLVLYRSVVVVVVISVVIVSVVVSVAIASVVVVSVVVVSVLEVSVVFVSVDLKVIDFVIDLCTLYKCLSLTMNDS